MSLKALEQKVSELQADEYAAIDRDPDLSEEGKKDIMTEIFTWLLVSHITTFIAGCLLANIIIKHIEE